MAQPALSFRRMEWRMWRHSYISQVPEAERLAWIRPCGEAQPGESNLAPAIVQDISLGGISFSVSRSIPSGMLLKVELPSFARDPIELLARVLHVRSQPGGANWLLVCCFARELTDEVLQQFGARRERPEKDDGRSWVRFPCAADTTVHVVLAAEPTEWHARIVNISAGGVGLIVPGVLEGGTLLNLDLRDPSNQQEPRTILIRVVHCDPEDNAYRLGCTFVDELKDEDLRLLM
ncbi:MAG: PilZ domain-containing protein [Gemmataceae bacterium]